jgi:RND family efflux transporter MFP subunit
LAALLALSAVGHCGESEAIDGFTEPQRTVKVATAEVGVIKTVEVREGDRVTVGQTLATLDSEQHAALLAIAAAQMGARGKLESALAELALRRDKLAKLKSLRNDGHARQEEVDRARTDVSIAEAQVLSAQEESQVLQLEHTRARLQDDRRTIQSPLDGIVIKAHKQVGEFVAPHDGVLFTVVQLDPLVATFSVPSPQVGDLRAREKVTVMIGGIDAAGTVDFVSPVTDAESGTVRVTVQIANPQSTYRSGERCTLRLPPISRTKAP